MRFCHAVLRRFLCRNRPPGLSSRPPLTSRHPPQGATLGGLPLHEGGRAAGASWSVSLRQSPKRASTRRTGHPVGALLGLDRMPKVKTLHRKRAEFGEQHQAAKQAPPAEDLMCRNVANAYPRRRIPRCIMGRASLCSLSPARSTSTVGRMPARAIRHCAIRPRTTIANTRLTKSATSASTPKRRNRYRVPPHAVSDINTAPM
jgi:hypothetical protein